MAIQHASIPDANRHEAKGASIATNGQVLKANGNGTTSFVNPITLSNIAVSSVLEGQSTVTQNPTGTDAPYQVTWGGVNSNSDVTIASNGIVTINSAGLYLVTINLSFGKLNNVGVAKMLGRLLINGAAYGAPVVAQIDASTDIRTVELNVLRAFNTSDTIVAQILRDSTGANDGGLYSIDPVLAGWATSPSAAIRLQKIAGGS